MSDNNLHISVAPMMDWTDRHCRHLHRLIAPSVRLYTEMVTTGAILHGDRDRFLDFDPSEHPVALQLGGADPADLAESAKIGADFGYDEINFNCGCPSDRVQKGSFGACLMAEPELVAKCMKAMSSAVSVPVTVKCRVGIDDVDDGPFLDKFVRTLMEEAGCETFIIHARKAILQGLSPKENRKVPPIRYDLVNEIKARYPHLTVIVNGEIKTCDDVRMHLETLDGAMIGREAYQNPWVLRGMEETFFGTKDLPDEIEVIGIMADYAARMAAEYGTPVKSITRHMTGLFSGQRGAKRWRQALSTLPHEDGADANCIREALAQALEAMDRAA